MIAYDMRSHFSKDNGKRNEENDISFKSGRRYAIMSVAGLIAGFSIRKFIGYVPEDAILPPAALKPELFNSLCCRCGSCIKACPTKIIAFNTTPDNLLSFMTPEVEFGPGYCLEQCNLCSRVCPTGAIALFDPDAKSQLFMGSAVITLPDCRLQNNSECNKCRASCKYEAIEFYHASGYLDMYPVVDENKCVGCGACMVACPENCIRILPLPAQA